MRMLPILFLVIALIGLNGTSSRSSMQHLSVFSPWVQIPSDSSFQHRIDSLEPIIIHYHKLQQHQQQMQSALSALAVRIDSIQVSIQEQKDVLAKSVDSFIQDSAFIIKMYPSADFKKAKKNFMFGLMENILKVQVAGKQLDLFIKSANTSQIGSGPEWMQQQKLLFDQKQQALQAYYKYVAIAKGMDFALFRSSAVFKELNIALEKFADLDERARDAKQQQIILKQQSDSVAAISVALPAATLDGRSIFPPQLRTGKSVAMHRFLFNQNRYIVVLVDPAHHHIRIHSNSTKKLQPLKRTWNSLIKAGKQPMMVMNGGMFERDGSSVGWIISQGRKIKDLDVSEKPLADNFHLYPNGVFYIDKFRQAFVTQTRSVMKMSASEKKNIFHATQSGPMLVINDSIHPAFRLGSSSLHIRNGVGIMEGGNHRQVAFLISETKINFFELALVFKYILNCRNALYLDGSISRMYYKDSKRAISYGDLKGELGPVISISSK